MQLYTDYERVYTNYLMHHGTKGMKWGVRRALKKYGRYYDDAISNLNEQDPRYNKTKKILLRDKANLNKLTSKKDIKNKTQFDFLKYNTMQTASLTSKKANLQKLNKIMEKDWANNKVQITKEMKTQRRLGKATVASALAAYGGIAIYAIGMISKNNKLKNAGLAVSLGGTAGTVAGIAALDGGTKLSRRKYEYTNRKDIY